MGVGRRALNGDWCTPKGLLDRVRVAFGGRIELDPCSHACSIVRAAHEWLPQREDGLAAEWSFATIFVNPPLASRERRKPGGGVGAWLAKCADAHARHHAEVIALVPATPTSGAWQDNVWGEAQAVCFLYADTVEFHVDGRPVGGVRMPYAVVYWGGRFERFERAFGAAGAVLDVRTICVPCPEGRYGCRLLSPFSKPADGPGLRPKAPRRGSLRADMVPLK